MSDTDDCDTYDDTYSGDYDYASETNESDNSASEHQFDINNNTNNIKGIDNETESDTDETNISTTSCSSEADEPLIGYVNARKKEYPKTKHPNNMTLSDAYELISIKPEITKNTTDYELEKYKCTICGEGFMQQNNFANHLWSHRLTDFSLIHSKKKTNQGINN